MHKKPERLICARRIEFDAAHRIIGHAGKCKYLHGHRYILEASFEAQFKGARDMVVDFGLIKEVLANWINCNWDHTTILSIDDRELGSCIEHYTKQKIFYMDKAPTAENMSTILIREIIPSLFKGTDVNCYKVRIYETPNCYAEIE
ncbi:6-carboxytetrahydropterin synthase [Candidatus Cyrtobacter comes]|uniref:6-carboxy-5,6,7,8-tetrahydropterin synthase n=1 Tax=Candidatus Cyrtobacter comes TaxID=675776 RepID=A0ABU5L7G3_9RICK|nr:6-carboxytetrahydropterin synthase [Candidatus Cyrtobacter comes]MDZ5762068.1 6-carboxytetrahydropterin synthase [Candidatus Cyrtobacter comes]